MFYNATFTSDLRDCANQLNHRYENARFRILVTFSMGSNIAFKYLAEEGANAPFDSCCAVGCPFDMHLISDRMSRVPGLIYSKFLVRGLHRFLERNESVLQNAPFCIKSGLQTKTGRFYFFIIFYPISF